MFLFLYFLNHTKLDSLRQKKARCEKLQKDLDKLRKNLEECRNETASSANHVNQIKGEEATNQRPVEDYNISHYWSENMYSTCEKVSHILCSVFRLRKLRSSVARLLVTLVPALDPDQVNYDCEVIWDSEPGFTGHFSIWNHFNLKLLCHRHVYYKFLLGEMRPNILLYSENIS